MPPVGTPSWASIAARVAGLTGPAWASFARAASAGEPGMSRGSRKFSVIAAHAVRISKPSLRRMYRTVCSPSSGGSGCGGHGRRAARRPCPPHPEPPDEGEHTVRYILRKLGLLILTAWAAITLNFLLPRLMPGSPADAALAKLAQAGPVSPATRAAIEAQLGVPTGGIGSQYVQYLG